MKEKQGVNAIVVLIMVLIFLVIGIIFGQYFYSQDIFKIFIQNNTNKIENKEILNTDTSLKGKKYVLNLDNDEYIYFIDDNNYEYKYLEESYTNVQLKKGTYKYSNNNITFDDNTKAVIENNKLVLKDNSKYDELLAGNKIYYDQSIIVSEFSKMSDLVFNYVQNMKNTNASLATVSRVQTDISACYEKNNGNIVCSIGYNVFFTEAEDYTQKTCDTNEMNKFNSYTVSSGYCSYSNVYNWSFFEFKLDNNNYSISSTYTG